MAKDADYEFRRYKVEDVNLNTDADDSKSQQMTFKNIYYKNAPFDGYYTIDPKITRHDGIIELGLYVNADKNKKVGSIPQEYVPEIIAMQDRYVDSNIQVFGGDDEGWTAEITLRFRKTAENMFNESNSAGAVKKTHSTPVNILLFISMLVSFVLFIIAYRKSPDISAWVWIFIAAVICVIIITAKVERGAGEAAAIVGSAITLLVLLVFLYMYLKTVIL